VNLRLACIAAFLPLAGCGWLPDAYTGCNDAQPYHSARQADPLRVPAGADQPDTAKALRIPEVSAPELPADPNRCLEHPPPYSATPATPAAPPPPAEPPAG
jgi:uncharacterized lipoprotein